MDLLPLVFSELPSGPHLKLDFYIQFVLLAAETDTNYHNAHNAGVILFDTDRMSPLLLHYSYCCRAQVASGAEGP
jgi:hypothetical protein